MQLTAFLTKGSKELTCSRMSLKYLETYFASITPFLLSLCAILFKGALSSGCVIDPFGGSQPISLLVATPHVPPIADQSNSPASRPLSRNPSQYMYGRSSRMYDILLAYGGDVTTRSKGPSTTRFKFLASPNTTCPVPLGLSPAPANTNCKSSIKLRSMSAPKGTLD